MGHLRWQQLREACRERKGASFDLKRFHSQALRWGAVPLALLDGLVDRISALA